MYCHKKVKIVFTVQIMFTGPQYMARRSFNSFDYDYPTPRIEDLNSNKMVAPEELDKIINDLSQLEKNSGRRYMTFFLYG